MSNATGRLGTHTHHDTQTTITLVRMRRALTKCLDMSASLHTYSHVHKCTIPQAVLPIIIHPLLPSTYSVQVDVRAGTGEETCSAKCQWQERPKWIISAIILSSQHLLNSVQWHVSLWTSTSFSLSLTHTKNHVHTLTCDFCFWCPPLLPPTITCAPSAHKHTCIHTSPFFSSHTHTHKVAKGMVILVSVSELVPVAVMSLPISSFAVGCHT